ncbi:uncharacterized protein METZ01_LOCUS421472, partial [marine metagenome]
EELTAGTDLLDPDSKPLTVQLSGNNVVLDASNYEDFDDGSSMIIFKYDSANDNGQSQTEYTIDFPSNVVSDVLVVGGGGGGGQDRAGGGGSGATIMYKNYKMNGDYTIGVGKFGINKQNGIDSFIQKSNSDLFRAKGGGHGSFAAGTAGTDGGSGGGTPSQSGFIGGAALATNVVPISDTETGMFGPSETEDYVIYGNQGGNSTNTLWVGNLDILDGGGGGGIGDGGSISGDLYPVDSQYTTNNPGRGGNGRYDAVINGVSYNFKDYFGLS